MPQTISLSKARMLLEQAVLTQGSDFVYSPGGRATCYYTKLSTSKAVALGGILAPTTQSETEETGRSEEDPRTKTGCLIGVSLSLHGVDVTKLSGPIFEVHAPV